MDNLTAVLRSVKDIALEQRPVPEPKENEVQLRMGFVGICGSDVHYWTQGRIGDFVLKAPMVIGHEASGTVTKLGANVTNLNIGDRVAIEPGVPCWGCSFCKGGKYNLCPGMRFCATPPYHGNLARFYVHPANLCFRLGEQVSLEEGALLEPLSVGVHACKRGAVQQGSKVLVLGAGPIGLVTSLAAKGLGAASLLLTDVDAQRLEIGKKCGADDVLVVNPSEDEISLSKRVVEALGGEPDVTIDCAGFQSTAQLAIQVTKPGGNYVLVGMGAQDVKVSLVKAAIKEINILGSFRYCNDYQDALDLVSQGKANVKQLITHNFQIEETVKAFETCLNGTGNPIKIMIQC